MNVDPVERRGDAWELGLQGSYDAALDILNELLSQDPNSIVSLRMKGNLLELKALDMTEKTAKKLSSSTDYLAARRCYDQILQLDPSNLAARLDLGDHFKNLGANDRALEYYAAAAAELKRREKDSDWEQNVSDLLDGITQVGANAKRSDLAREIDKWCRQVLEARQRR